MFDRDALIAACTARGRVVRVVVAAVHGSAPREAGAAMLVWDNGQSGTIGGGQLEFELTALARTLPGDRLSRHALGPEMGQCCGGAVEVLSEVYDLDRARALPEDVIARGAGEMPMSVKRLMRSARNQGHRPGPQLRDGWMIEPVRTEPQPLWIWGAGHVGRAMVDLFQHFEQFQITWVDTSADRFPNAVPEGVQDIVAADPALLMPRAPVDAQHLILTYSHAIDLGLCHAALSHGFAGCGLIGSRTKWARFRKRLSALGHCDAQIARIQCPIGDPSLGKAPHMVALGVLHDLTRRAPVADFAKVRA
ncbi:MAG: xanthine dehydrogenase accessory protein XdhC [Pseudomonadota bacterium]